MKRDRQQNETSIISIEKHSQNYSLIDNAGLRDSVLTYKATGLWAFLISHPPDWQININHLINSKADGRDSVLSGLCELYDAGYLLYLKWRSADGTFGSQYIVFESAQLKEKYLDRMNEDDKTKIATPYNPKSRTKKNQSETTTENPLWSGNGKTVTENPLPQNRYGKSDQTNNIYTNDSETNDLKQIKSPLTPQGEVVGKNFVDNSFEIQDASEEDAIANPLPTQKTQNQPLVQTEIPPQRINVPAIENDSRFVASDPTAENMEARGAIAATGAMQGSSCIDPGFLEFYRLFLNGCDAYKKRGRECTTHHAKSSLGKLWRDDPLRILGEIENWQKSKATTAQYPDTQNIDEIPEDELDALLKAIEDKTPGVDS